MGMYDSLYVDGFYCDKCNHITDHVEIQFKPYVGNTYSPWCEVLAVGDRMPDEFPPISVDFDGCTNCENCQHFFHCYVRIKKGIITGWWVHDPDIIVQIQDLPQPSNKKRLRKKAISKEWYERECLKYFGTRQPNALQAMTLPIRGILEWDSFARQVFRHIPIGSKRIGNYVKTENGWIKHVKEQAFTTSN